MACVNDTSTFRSQRRRGLRGRIGLFRARVENDQEEALRVRSPKLAQTIAVLLNEGVEDSSSVPPSRVIRYSAVSGRGSETMVVAAERGRDAGRFGDGIVAVTDDRELAERVAAVLNRLDPAHFKQAQKGPGFGWF
jgi:hypothetical protein